jgi:hypothetical protein
MIKPGASRRSWVIVITKAKPILIPHGEVICFGVSVEYL